MQTNSSYNELKAVDLQGMVEGWYRHFSVVVWESIISIGRSGRIDVNIFCSSLERCYLGFEGRHAPCWRWVLLYLEFVPGTHSGWSGVLISVLSGNQNKLKENWGTIQPLDFFIFSFHTRNQILPYCSGIMDINKLQCICAQKSGLVSFVWYGYLHFLFIFNYVIKEKPTFVSAFQHAFHSCYLLELQGEIFGWIWWNTFCRSISWLII